jgi:hypothetical protein
VVITMVACFGGKMFPNFYPQSTSQSKSDPELISKMLFSRSSV